MISDIEKGQTGEDLPNVDEILYGQRQAPYTLEDLRAFLNQELNEENLDAYLGMEEYAQKFDQKQAPRKIDNASSVSSKSSDEGSFRKAIIDEFVIPNAPKEINISSEMRNEILDKDKSGKTSNIFSRAQTEVKKLIETDAFPRFLKQVTTKNITKSHANWRVRVGVYLTVLGLLAAAALISLELLDLINFPYLRMLVFPFFMIGSAYIISGRQCVCTGLALANVRMREGKRNWKDVFYKPKSDDQVADKFAKRRLRRIAIKQIVQSAIAGTVATCAIFFIPVGAALFTIS